MFLFLHTNMKLVVGIPLICFLIGDDIYVLCVMWVCTGARGGQLCAMCVRTGAGYNTSALCGPTCEHRCRMSEMAGTGAGVFSVFR